MPVHPSAVAAISLPLVVRTSAGFGVSDGAGTGSKCQVKVNRSAYQNPWPLISERGQMAL